jgi:hypothetical protein
MATTHELYISISPRDYRVNKSSVLMSQADLLHTLKRMHNMKVLARQKQDLKKIFHKLLLSTLNELDSIRENMPSPKIPKEMKRDAPKKSKESKEVLLKRNDIDEELMQIQAKLRELNSY